MEYPSVKLDEVYREFNSSGNGLTGEQAKQGLVKYGPNELVEKHKISAIEIFINQFKGFVVGILIVAFIISLALNEMVEAVAILLILVLNAVLGFVQEYKAERAIEALKKMASPKARVIRDGRETLIDSRDVVPGDILVLSTGDKIAADSRITESINLETLEASLTGESTPVEKRECTLRLGTPVANRINMVYAGTIITKGHGRAIAVSTGMGTEFGRIAQLIQETPEELTPLQKKLKEMSKSIGIFSIAICVMIFIVSFIGGIGLGDSIKESLALAVAAIPEGLPAVVTISLAIGVQRMVRRHTLIRRLPSVETLGSTTVICTDKTGTLTHNEMTVRRIFANGQVVEVSGAGYSREGRFSSSPKDFDMLLKIGLLNNDARIEEGRVMGDPTEACLIVSAEKAGLKRKALEGAYPRIDEIQFDSERKLMTTIHRPKKTRIAFTKGAPDKIVKICDRILINGKVKKLSSSERKKILNKNDEFSRGALRVLGFAYKELKKEKKKDIEKRMVFVGLQAMIDPPRKEVGDSIAECKGAGIKVVMITGDYRGTAEAIARELGIEGRAITGEELDRIKNLDEVVEEIGVYARVNPEHKMRIVEAFKRRGHIVAMTGDGVNDAPALKNADIGIAMGISGTDVAKEASDAILTDDNFASIVGAVEEGRGVYENIRNFVRYLLGCNIGEVLTIFIGVLLGFPLVLLPLQILLMNIVTDGLPALALGVEPIDRNIMQRKPRKPNERIFSLDAFIRMILIGIIMCIGTLFVFWKYKDIDLVKAQTMAFTTLVFFQMFYVLTTRSEKRSFFQMDVFSNMYLIYAVVSSIIIQLLVIYTPLSLVINKGLVGIGLVDWLYIVLVSGSVFVIVEAMKIAGGLRDKDGRA